MSKRTLKCLRREAPAADRIEPALAARVEPHWAKARDGSPYVAVSIWPRTLDELRKMCREYGPAAVARVQWGCFESWLMRGPAPADLFNSFAVASSAVAMIKERDQCQLGLPHHEGREWQPPALIRLSQEVREEAERVAAETLSDWERVGKPYLGLSRIKSAYQYVISCPAFRDKYVGPADEAGVEEQE